nr:CD44 antigen isoform X19 [Anas platyrhynchos]
MASFYVWATFGLCLLKLCLTETQFNVSCRYRGVFHVEKNGRYSLTRTEAADLCRALNSTLSTLEQLEKAHELGFETCRYGFVVGYIVIPRINPYHLCAANHTGIYKLSANTTGRYDAYCYNATETRDKACEPIERIDTSFLSNQGEIVIDNEDGSRYNADGTRHSGDSSTSGVDDENVGSGSSHDTTPVDTSIRRSSPSYYGSVTPVSHLSDHSSGGGEKEFPVTNSDDEISPTSTDISLVTGFDDFAKEDDERHRGSTTPGPPRVHLEKTTTQTWWNPFSNEWWWSNPREKTQEPTQTTRADVTSSGNGSDDEDSSEETTYPTVFPGWDISVAKKEYAPSTTPGPPHVHLEKTTTQTWWNPFSNEWWWSNPREKTQEPTQTTRADVTSSGNGSDDEDSSEETTYPTVFPGWDISVAKKEYAPSTTLATPDGAHHEDSTQPPLSSDNEVGWGTEGITHSTDAPGGEVLHGLNPASTNEAGDDSLLTGTITESMDAVSREEATKEPLAPSAQPGSESEQANTTDGSYVNLVPGVFSDIDDHHNQLQTLLSTTLATPDGAHHEDSTQPPLSSDNEEGWGTEGITHSTDAPGGEVLHGLNPASTNEAGDDSLLTGTTTAKIDVLEPADVTQEVWTPRVIITALATPDGAHHEDSTQPPLSSDNEVGWGTEGITHSTDAPGGEVLHGLNPASTNEAGDDSLLTGTITESMDVVGREEATKEPLAPSAQPGSESEQANTTDGSYVNLVPGVFSDIDDHHNQLQTPLPPRSTTIIDGDHGSRKGNFEPTPNPGENATTTITSEPRSSQIPDWLIIVAALLALALILVVCIAVSSRRRCGQKKKLVINNGKGAVEDRKTSELNGDASKSQEMVHLVHKEQSNDRTGASDEFLTIDETQNHQELDMKSGV